MPCDRKSKRDAKKTYAPQTSMQAVFRHQKVHHSTFAIYLDAICRILSRPELFDARERPGISQPFLFRVGKFDLVNIELFGMQAGIALDDDVLADHLFKLRQP